MKSLTSFLDRENAMARIFKQKEIAVPLSQEDVNSLVDRLSSNLSPECLTCDGERSKAQVRSFYKLYTGAYKDLTKYGEKNGLVVPELSY